MTTNTAHINTYRQATDRLRKLTINPSRTSRPTYRENTIKFYEMRANNAMDHLMNVDLDMAGHLTEERMLLDRLAISNFENVRRPDLQKRLRTIRKTIKKVMA